MVRNAEGGKVHVSEVMPLLKAQSVKPKDVIASLKGEIFWSHQEAECEARYVWSLL